jgi:hypothetical protein
MSPAPAVGAYPGATPFTYLAFTEIVGAVCVCGCCAHVPTPAARNITKNINFKNFIILSCS